MEVCANCEVPIGKLETACAWKDQVVCEKCFGRLKGDDRTEGIDGIEEEIEAAERASGKKYESKPSSVLSGKRVPMDGEVICSNPNCGFVGVPEKKSRGSTIVLIVLLFIAVLPGILYLIFASGHDYFCPRCGAKLRSESR